MSDGSVDVEVKLEDSKAKAQARTTGNELARGIESGLKGASSAARNTENDIKSAMGGAASSASSSFSDVSSAANASFGDIGDAARNASSDAASSFGNIPSSAAGSFSDVGSEAESGFDAVAEAAEDASDKASDAFGEVESAVGDMARNSIPHANTIENVLGKSIPAAAAVAAAAVVAIVAAFAKVSAEAVNVGMEFDKSMSQVAATMGVTTDEIGELRDFAQEMGSSTAFSATEASEALNYMALAGYDAATSMRVLPTVLNLAAAGNMDLALASDMVTDAQSALGLSVEEAEVMVDQMAKTSSRTNTSVQQLGDAFLTVGGTAKNLRGGTAELSQMLGILADNGIKGSEGGTALRNVILSLSAPTDKAAESIKALGLEVFDAEGNMRSMPEIMNDLNDAMEPLTQQERTEVLNEIFNKVDLKSVNALLGTSAERFDEVAAAIDDAQGSAEAMANTQLDNLAGDVTLLQSATEGLLIGVSDYLTPALRGMVQIAYESFGELTEIWADALETGDFTEVGEKIGQMVLDLVGAVIEEIPELLSTALEIIGGIVIGIAEALPRFVNQLVAAAAQMVPQFLQAAINIVLAIVRALPVIITNLVNAIPGIIVSVVSALTEAIPILIDGFIELFLAVTEALPQIIESLIDATPYIVSVLSQTLIDNMPTLIDGFVRLFVAFAKAIPQIIANILAVLPKILTSILSNMASWGGSLFSKAVEMFGQFVSGIASRIGDIVGKVREIPGMILNALGNTGSLLVNAGRNIIDGFLNGLKGAFDGVKNFIGGIGSWIQEHKGPREYDLKLLVPAGGWIMDGLREGLEDAIPELERTMKEITGAVDVSVSAWDDAVMIGERMARGLIVGYDRIDPAGRIIASLGMMGAMTNNQTTNYNSTLNVNRLVSSPEELFMQQRINERRGLAGRYV